MNAQWLILRAEATALMRSFFAVEQFVEVTTPSRVAAPGTDVHIEPVAVGAGFDQPTEWLITSPEFHMKRLLADGMERIFQLCQCHRQEELGDWHQPEFTLLEWYRANSGFEQVLQDTEHLLELLADRFAPQGVATAPIQASMHSTVADVVSVKAPFERITVRQAFQRWANIPDASELALEDEQAFFQLLVDRVEPALAAYERPVFLTEYPASQAALARPCPHDSTVAERFELYVAGVELCNGYGELVDPEVQRERFNRDNRKRQRRGQSVLPLDEELLTALGRMPPSGGNALGFERLLALLFGCQLRDVAAFPR